MSNKLSIQNLSLAEKKTLVRVDFNVPQDKNHRITDDTRIRAALKTIQYIIDNNGSAILMSHLGRPKGKRIPEMSLKPCAERLSDLLNLPVIMAPDSIGPEVKALVQNLQPKQILMLENLRFYQAEERPEEDPDFARQLASLGDLYVNDAFGTAHRTHSSTVKITEYFPNRSASGFLMEKEINFLGDNLLNPKKPFYAIIGGAKVSSKIGVIRSLIKKVDGIAIVGGMAYTFLKSKGISIGESLCEDSFLETAQDVIQACEKHNVHLILPTDFIVADSFKNDANTKVMTIEEGIPTESQGLDIGPQSIKNVTEMLGNAKTILWNGPAGVFEFSAFAKGTFEIAKTLANSSATTIIGGGDSIAAIKSSGLDKRIDHISTGGGASLEYIEFGRLPGIDALSEKTQKETIPS